jgi:NAD(P)-dependent dehydrogenase (short-subunit alcohol dehydrogenase family)
MRAFEMAANLKNKTAIITGATSGLGADAAVAYAEAGANVVLIGRREVKLSEMASRIKAAGGRVLLAVCDVTREEDVQKAVTSAVAEFGEIHILLNNAGKATSGRVDTLPTEDWLGTFDVNVHGIYYMCKYVLPHMIRNRYGKIINMSSVNAFIGAKGGARHAYNASKAAICGLTIAMAATYMSEGITINAICPGLFETEMTRDSVFGNKVVLATYNRKVPASRPGKRGELNGTIMFLSSDDSSYITGQCLAVDGGDSISSII